MGFEVSAVVELRIPFSWDDTASYPRRMESSK
jgi:hypothetical protein